MKAYFDSREQSVIADLNHAPIRLVAERVKEAVTDAEVHRARQAQKAERMAAIQANLTAAQQDLQMTQMLDTLHAQRVADVMPPDLSLQERRQAGAVAVRLHDPHWQALTHYRAAEGILRELRTLLVAHGLNGQISDKDLRKAAEQMDRTAFAARMRTWDGSEPVRAETWTKAKLGILVVSEEA